MVYSNVALMLSDCQAYIRMTGNRIMIADDTRAGVYGYISEDRTQTWHVHFLRMDDPDTVKIGPARDALLQDMHEQASQGTIQDTDFLKNLVSQWTTMRKDQTKDQTGEQVRMVIPRQGLRS